jgi:Winged helix DNA-binding domain
MKLSDVSNIRLNSQQIGVAKFNTVKDVVNWMGAMQAQDYAMAKWAIGVRLPNSLDQVISASIDSGDILRTHLLRPTWHFVSNDDIFWILELTAHQIKGSFKSRHIQLGLSEAVLRKSNIVIEKALRGGTHLSREELMVELGKAKIATDLNRASHLFAWAELDGLICSGATKGGKQTYALLEERVPNKTTFTKEEALATLANKYFTSRCPATLKDFKWWSGLSVSDAKHALELVASEFISEKIGSQIYWYANSDSVPYVNKDAVYLLPAYDEFIISYKDRSASLLVETQNKTVSNNGIFRPVIVVNGQVKGTWNRKVKKDKVVVEAEFFEKPSKTAKSLIEEATIQYGHFLNTKTETYINF